MSKSSGRSMFGSNKGQTVTVIDAPIARSQRRKAVIAFWVALFVVGLLAGVVASHYLHPIAGGLLGLLAGVVVGAVLFALIVAWPVLRIIWHWLSNFQALSFERRRGCWRRSARAYRGYRFFQIQLYQDRCYVLGSTR